MKVIVLLAVVLAPALEAQVHRRGDTIFVADRFLGDSAVAYSLFAKFHTASARAGELRLDMPLPEPSPRVQTLGDVVVNISLDGNGFVAVWIVAGPRQVVDPYIARMRLRMADRAVIYDSSVLKLVVRCACD